jgi:hypothetical protein
MMFDNISQVLIARKAVKTTNEREDESNPGLGLGKHACSSRNTVQSAQQASIVD